MGDRDGALRLPVGCVQRLDYFPEGPVIVRGAPVSIAVHTTLRFNGVEMIGTWYRGNDLSSHDYVA